MAQRLKATFYPQQEKGFKQKFYERTTVLLGAVIILNSSLLVFLLYPILKNVYKGGETVVTEDVKHKEEPVVIKEIEEFNANHLPYFFSGHSAPSSVNKTSLSATGFHANLISKMSPAQEKKNNVSTKMHKIKDGETLFSIAKEHSCSVEWLKTINEIEGNNLTPGRILKIQKINGVVGYYGIDVSSWQNNINWESVHNDTSKVPLNLYIIKATQGISIKDPYFKKNWENAKQKGSHVGAYHFYVANDDPKLQANNFIKQVSLDQGDIKPIIDLEFDCANCGTLGISTEQYVKNIKVFIEIIENHYHEKPILYSNLYFHNEYLKDNFSDYSFWLAAYSNKAPESLSLFDDTIPVDSTLNTVMWQFSSQEHVKGIVGNVDMSFLPKHNLDSLLCNGN